MHQIFIWAFLQEKKVLKRERLVVDWLTFIQQDAHAIYLVGDLFDFWFEYKKVVPKGFVRLLGKLAELKDKGIDIHIFTGNHDVWMRDYFTEELGIPIHRSPIKVELGGKKFLIGHGDGLGPADKGYKALKKIFTNPVCKWAFRQLHPDLGIRLANYWSQKNRFLQGTEEEEFLGEEKEWLIIYAKEVLKTEHIDYFIFGHRHLPIKHNINEKSKYINLGEWFNYNSYAVFDGKDVSLQYFK